MAPCALVSAAASVLVAASAQAFPLRAPALVLRFPVRAPVLAAALLVGRAGAGVSAFRHRVDKRLEGVVIQIAAPVGKVGGLNLTETKGDIHIVDEGGKENVASGAFIRFVGDEARRHRMARPDHDD